MMIAIISQIILLVCINFINKSTSPAKARLKKAERENVRRKQPVLINKTRKRSHDGILGRIVSCGT